MDRQGAVSTSLPRFLQALQCRCFIGLPSKEVSHALSGVRPAGLDAIPVSPQCFGAQHLGKLGHHGSHIRRSPRHFENIGLASRILDHSLVTQVIEQEFQIPPLLTTIPVLDRLKDKLVPGILKPLWANKVQRGLNFWTVTIFDQKAQDFLLN